MKMTRRMLSMLSAIKLAVTPKQLNWKYRVNLKEETFSSAKVIEIMARGRLLYERMTSLFNTPLEEIQ